jgi:hypothetical protein
LIAADWYQPMGVGSDYDDDGSGDELEDGDDAMDEEMPKLTRKLGRLDRLIDFLIDTSATREYDGESISPIVDKINKIADESVRELLHELQDPKLRLALCIFQLYGTGGAPLDTERDGDENEDGDEESHPAVMNAMQTFLHFTENDSEGIFFKIHRVVRRRLKYLRTLASEDEEDGGALYELACAQLIKYVESEGGNVRGWPSIPQPLVCPLSAVCC